MVSKTSAAQWLADHVGADWLHVALPCNGVDSAIALVTLRFNKDYCQSLVKLELSHSSHAELHRALIKSISEVREEFFLFNMHAIPPADGVKLEIQSRA